MIPRQLVYHPQSNQAHEWLSSSSCLAKRDKPIIMDGQVLILNRMLGSNILHAPELSRVNRRVWIVSRSSLHTLRLAE